MRRPAYLTRYTTGRNTERNWVYANTLAPCFFTPLTSIEVVVDTHTAYRTCARNADRSV